MYGTASSGQVDPVEMYGASSSFRYAGIEAVVNLYIAGVFTVILLFIIYTQNYHVRGLIITITRNDLKFKITVISVFNKLFNSY